MTTASRAHAYLPQPDHVHCGARVDWAQLILDIQRSEWLSGAGQWLAMRKIAVAVGRSEGWVWNLKNIPETEPRYHDALMLIGLWVEKTGGKVLPILQDSEQAKRTHSPGAISQP